MVSFASTAGLGAYTIDEAAAAFTFMAKLALYGSKESALQAAKETALSGNQSKIVGETTPQGIYKLPRNDDGKIWFSREFALLEPYNGPGAKKGDYILLEEFWVSWEHDGKIYRFRCPKGMITDIASVPRFVWTIGGILPDGLHRNAAVVHDPQYGWQGFFPYGWFQMQNIMGEWVNCPLEWNRDMVDRLFFRILKASGVDDWTRFRMYYALRGFGWYAWNGKDIDFQNKYRYAFING